MRLPRVRFTVRRMMVVVAVVGLVLGGTIWLERRRQRLFRTVEEFQRHVESDQTAVLDSAYERAFGPPSMSATSVMPYQLMMAATFGTALSEPENPPPARRFGCSSLTNRNIAPKIGRRAGRN